MESIAEKICNLRKGKGLSQEELASALFVSRQTVSKWERGQSLPDADNITAMSAFFGVSADELLGCNTVCAQQTESMPQEAPCEKPVKKRLWLKILIISLVCFFALMGLMAMITFVFMLTMEKDPLIWNIVVPMICVMAVVIFSIVTTVVTVIYKKSKKPRR